VKNNLFESIQHINCATKIIVNSATCFKHQEADAMQNDSSTFTTRNLLRKKKEVGSAHNCQSQRNRLRWKIETRTIRTCVNT